MDDRYEHIEKYLKGELESEQEKSFTQEIKSDDNLARQVEFYRQAMESVVIGIKREEESAEFKTTLDLLRPKYFSEEKPASRPLWLWISSAAAVVIIMIGIYFGALRPPLNERLYNEFAAHEDLPVTLSSSPEENLKEGVLLFNQKKYAEALPLLESFYQSNPEDFRILNAIGVCQLELDQYTDAQNSFERIIENSDIFRDQGQWYLAMVYLKQNDMDKCRNELQALAERSGGFQQKAQSLLSRLE